MKTARPATLVELKQGLADLAVIIERSPRGEKLWVLFDHLDAEITRRESRSDRLAAARAGTDRQVSRG